MLVLGWLVWYISGPVCEFCDFWDPPLQEVHDVLFYGGGGITLIAAGFAIALGLAQKLRDCCARVVRSRRLPFRPIELFRADLIIFLQTSDTSVHSPPLLLRI